MTESVKIPEVHIGTSGYSFKDWLGEFYPAALPSGEMLPFYASRFDTVEVNFTYYRMPTARTIAGMATRTPDGFQFFVKAHKSFTHERDLSGRSEFLAALEPMREAGKLAGLLFQFPQSFKNSQENRRFLVETARKFEGHVLAIEFRDRSWNTEEVYSLLENSGLAFVSVDEPQISTLFPRVGKATGEVGYVRFHSRDASKWYKGASERYNYNYTEDDLKEWLPLISIIAERARKIFIYFNNCHHGSAAKNAEEMRRLLAGIG